MRIEDAAPWLLQCNKLGEEQQQQQHKDVLQALALTTLLDSNSNDPKSTLYAPAGRPAAERGGHKGAPRRVVAAKL
jgi:hypothetical protein